MQDKRFPKWRSWAAAAFLVIVGVAIASVWQRPAEKTTVPVVTTPMQKPPASPEPLAILDRSALLKATAKAASAFAAGNPVDSKVAELAGRRFELILPFGCEGPQPDGGRLENGWRYDPKKELLQVAFPSTISGVSQNLLDNVVAGGAADKFGRGFWIYREWLREPVCPVASKPVAMNMVADEPTVGIVEIVEADSPRSDDGGDRRYQVSKRVVLDKAPDDRGLRIVVSGRLPAGNEVPVQCFSTHKDRRPLCVILVEFDRVALTNAQGTETYGEWHN